ncbi:hypothetical protein VNO77_14592 [Canavalia gladiata]|uniref:Uncharacterized protein n=1 Tax=Canavalia gladiata TaxID=3824 RepID=A0AAN9LYB4_CANGL
MLVKPHARYWKFGIERSDSWTVIRLFNLPGAQLQERFRGRVMKFKGEGIKATQFKHERHYAEVIIFTYMPHTPPVLEAYKVEAKGLALAPLRYDNKTEFARVSDPLAFGQEHRNSFKLGVSSSSLVKAV